MIIKKMHWFTVEVSSIYSPRGAFRQAGGEVTAWQFNVFLAPQIYHVWGNRSTQTARRLFKTRVSYFTVWLPTVCLQCSSCQFSVHSWIVSGDAFDLWIWWLWWLLRGCSSLLLGPFAMEVGPDPDLAVFTVNPVAQIRFSGTLFRSS